MNSSLIARLFAPGDWGARKRRAALVHAHQIARVELLTLVTLVEAREQLLDGVAEGRPIAFGGRILPAVEARYKEAGLTAAKYLNSPESPLFHKRRHLYGVHLAREAARKTAA